MNLSSSHLDAFFEVAQTLNFTKAAGNLFISQSALSQRILNLEKELELTLFIRDRAGLRLTESALKLVRYCQIKQNLEREVLNSLRPGAASNSAGIIRIGGFSSIMSSVVIPALAGLSRNNQNVQIQTITKEVAELMDLGRRFPLHQLRPH